MSLSIGRTVRLFLVDGSPTGMMTAEILSWTGRALVAPRSRIPEVLKREEARGPGIYFLVGDDPKVPNQKAIYIGKSTNVADRIRSHDSTKDFWDRLCIITSKDQNLTEAHVGFLESKLISRATEARRATIENNTAPVYSSLPESDVADMLFWVEQTTLLLPVLGFDFLREPLQTTPVSGPQITESSPKRLELELKDNKYGVLANAVEVDGEYVVLKDSTARAAEDYASNTYAALRKQLIDTGKLTVSDNPMLLRFVQDVTFTSPSAASAVILNRNDNGRGSWKVRGTGKTLGEWQRDQALKA